MTSAGLWRAPLATLLGVVVMSMASTPVFAASRFDDTKNSAAENATRAGDIGVEDTSAQGVEAMPRRAITMLPLRAGDGVTSAQAAGVTAQLRAHLEILDVEGVIKLLPATKDDAKVQRRCKDAGEVDVNCLAGVADTRGAERLGRGLVLVDDEVAGLVVEVTVVVPSGHMSTPRRLTLTGDDHVDDPVLDRFARELFAEDSLRGHLVLDGAAGAAGDAVFIDGQRRGTLDANGAFTIRELKEGRHRVVVRRPEGRNGIFYDDFDREVVIHHNEERRIKVTLLPKGETANMAGEAAGGPPLLAIVGVGTGGVLLATGAVFGTLSLMDSLNVEERAEAQQLVFPRDTELVQRGRTFSVVANILYGAGAVAVGVGGALWALSGRDVDEEDDGTSVASVATVTNHTTSFATGAAR